MRAVCSRVVDEALDFCRASSPSYELAVKKLTPPCSQIAPSTAIESALTIKEVSPPGGARHGQATEPPRGGIFRPRGEVGRQFQPLQAHVQAVWTIGMGSSEQTSYHTSLLTLYSFLKAEWTT